MRQSAGIAGSSEPIHLPTHTAPAAWSRTTTDQIKTDQICHDKPTDRSCKALQSSKSSQHAVAVSQLILLSYQDANPLIIQQSVSGLMFQIRRQSTHVGQLYDSALTSRLVRLTTAYWQNKLNLPLLHLLQVQSGLLVAVLSAQVQILYLRTFHEHILLTPCAQSTNHPFQFPCKVSQLYLSI